MALCYGLEVVIINNTSIVSVKLTPLPLKKTPLSELQNRKKYLNFWSTTTIKQKKLCSPEVPSKTKL